MMVVPMRLEFNVNVSQVHVDRRALESLLDSPEVQAEIDRRADNVERHQLDHVPVKTGRLKRSIQKRKTPDGRGRQVGSFGVDYAVPVENGHQTSSGSFVQAQPYIKPSIDAARS